MHNVCMGNGTIVKCETAQAGWQTGVGLVLATRHGSSVVPTRITFRSLESNEKTPCSF